MYFDIAQYIKEIALVCCISGVICLLGDKMKGGLGNFIKIAAALVITFFIVSPVLKLEEADIRIDLPTITSCPTCPDTELFYRLLTEQTLIDLKNIAYKGISKNFGFDKEDISISFLGNFIDDEFNLTSCNLEILTLASLSKRNEIIDYIENNFGCTVTVRENVISK